MARYVDGYVIKIKKSKMRQYKKLAVIGRKMWMKHGALDYYECAGDDLSGHFGPGFKGLCKLKKDETAVFAFIVYRNKAHRTKVNKAVMKDPYMNSVPPAMPFKEKDFAMGGFKVIVNS